MYNRGYGRDQASPSDIMPHDITTRDQSISDIYHTPDDKKMVNFDCILAIESAKNEITRLKPELAPPSPPSTGPEPTASPSPTHAPTAP